MTARVERLLDRVVTAAAILALPLIAWGLWVGGARGVAALKEWKWRQSRVALVDSVLRHHTKSAALGITGQGQGEELLEFVDYECPVCRAADSLLTRVVPGRRDLKVVVLQLPLNIHKRAYAAAAAAVCVQQLGDFPTFHHSIYKVGVPAEDSGFWPLAHSAGVTDSIEFSKCQVATQTDRRIQADLDIAQRLGVYGTPTFVAAGAKLLGLEYLVRLSAELRTSAAP